MTHKKILVIEDEEHIRMGLEDDLTFEGFEVMSASDGESGLTLAQKDRYDCIILDVVLPGCDGFEVCRQLRQSGNKTPVIMLTARDQEIDKVLGLEIGADDYVTKPFSPRELLARIKALLRRSMPDQKIIKQYRFGSIEVDFEKYRLFKSGEEVHLTAYEFALLRLFIENRDRVLDRNTILDAVWGREVYVTSRTVDTHVAHLRKKIEDDAAHPQYIISVHGVGYRFQG